MLGLILFGFVPATFGAFACRDFLEAYELRKDPRGALAASTGARRPELATAETVQLESSNPERLPAPASVTEHTTLSLRRPSEDKDSARIV